MLAKPFTRARRVRFGVRAKVAQGLLGAAQKQAEAGHCVVAEMLLAFSGFGALSSGATSPGKFKRALDVNATAAAAATAIVDCHARARAAAAEPKEPADGV